MVCITQGGVYGVCMTCVYVGGGGGGGCTWGWKNSFIVLSSTGSTDSSHSTFKYLGTREKVRRMSVKNCALSRLVRTSRRPDMPMMARTMVTAAAGRGRAGEQRGKQKGWVLCVSGRGGSLQRAGEGR